MVWKDSGGFRRSEMCDRLFVILSIQDMHLLYMNYS